MLVSERWSGVTAGAAHEAAATGGRTRPALILARRPQALRWQNGSRTGHVRPLESGLE